MEEKHSQITLEENKPEELAAAASVAEETTPHKKKTGRLALIIGGALAGVLLIACAAVCGVAATGKTILPNTTILGVDVGGLTADQLREKWTREGTSACSETLITLRMDGEELEQVPLNKLGVSVTAEDAVNDAWNAGHGGGFLSDGWQLARSWFRPTEVAPRLTVDEKALQKAADELGKRLGAETVDGTYRLDEKKTDGLYVTKPRDGIHIDTAALSRAIRQAVSSGELDAVDCVYTTEKAKPIDLDKVYEEIHGEMANAGYDRATGELTEARIGVEFDVVQAKKLLEKAEPGAEIVIPGTVTFPAVTKENLKDVLFRDCLGSYTTYVSGSSNRVYNVRRAASFVDGSVVNSGGVFSYNDVVGYTDEANGYLPAPGYMGGKTVDMFGGGVCQVSSTLYYATLLSNLEIVTRYCHQFAPSYITWGCDATVSDGWPDYCFRNTTNYPIKIVTGYSGGYLTVSIYGTKLDDTYVVMVSETLSSEDWHTVYKDDPTMLKGTSKEEQTPYTGYHVRTWRNVYAGDGTLLSSNVEADSYYEMRNQIILVGTKEPPKPDPKPDPTPTPEPEPDPEPTPEPEPEPDPQPEPDPEPEPDPNPDPGDGGNAWRQRR